MKIFLYICIKQYIMNDITNSIIKMAMKIVSKDVRSPRCVREGKVKTDQTQTTKHDMASCMLSILDSLKIIDNDENSCETLGGETLSEMMFRKMKGYGIDLNKELGFTHLKPVVKKK